MTAWLVGTLLASSGLMVLVLLVREPVRRWFGPRVAYALWLLPALRCAVPSFTRTVERIIPAAAPTTALAFPLRAAADAPPGPSLIDQLGGWPVLLTAVWVAGAAIMLLAGLRVYYLQRSAVLSSAIPLARLDGITILRSECVTGPIAFGLLRRFIALPLDFDQRFTERERAFALDHELAHHRSGDLVANVIAFVLLCLQWFNPLAWVAHAAFRFDQEAACDARVLDKAAMADRSSYGGAIAKAASGRTLLFAGALDRPSTLSRRLSIMTNIPNRRARIWGFFLIGGGLFTALPLTATSAVQYVDHIAPVAPVAPARLPLSVQAVTAAATITPAVPAVAAAAVVPVAAAPAATTTGEPDIDFIGNDTVRINGVTKRWEELTPQERARIRVETDKARAQIRAQMAKLPEELANVRRERERFSSGDFEREMIEAKAGMQRALVELERESATLKALGKDPEKMKADVRRSLAELEGKDFGKMARDNLQALDPGKIQADVESAAKSLDRVTARLDQLDGK